MGTYKIYNFTDIHFGKQNNNRIRFDYTYGYLCKVVEHIIGDTDSEGDIVVFGGDLFDDRNIIDVMQLIEVKNLFAQLASRIKVYMVQGNHDQYERYDIKHSALDLFSDIENITVIDKPTLIKGDTVLLMPYYEDNDAFVRDINATRTKATKLLFCHAPITGNHFFSGKDSACVNADSLKCFDKVITGHFHQRNLYRNIHYTGAFQQNDFSDANLDNGFDVFVVDDKGKIADDVFVKNDCSPKYVVRNINTKEEFDDIVANCSHELKNNYVKFVIDRSIDDVVTKDLNSLNMRSLTYSFKKDLVIESIDSGVDYDNISMLGEINSYIDGFGLDENTATELKDIVKDAFDKYGDGQ